MNTFKPYRHPGLDFELRFFRRQWAPGFLVSSFLFTVSQFDLWKFHFLMNTSDIFLSPNESFKFESALDIIFYAVFFMCQTV